MLEKIHEEIASELVYSDVEEKGYTHIAYQFIEEHRWFNLYLIVFKYKDELYGIDHMCPSTEYQEGGEEFDTDSDDMVEVKPVQEKLIPSYEYV